MIITPPLPVKKLTSLFFSLVLCASLCLTAIPIQAEEVSHPGGEIATSEQASPETAAGQSSQKPALMAPNRFLAAAGTVTPLVEEVDRTVISVPSFPYPNVPELSFSLSDIFENKSRVHFDKPDAYTLRVTKNQPSDSGLHTTLEIPAGYDILLTGENGQEILTSQVNGSLFTVKNDATLTISGLTLDGDGWSHLIQVEEGGTLILEEGAVLQNCGSSAIVNDGTLILQEGAVLQNCGSSAIVNDGTLTMHGGTITRNDTLQKNIQRGNGGVLNCEGATFTMTGGSITCNGDVDDGQGANQNAASTKGYAGGVTNLGTFTMTGGEITGNQVAPSPSGMAAAGVYNGGRFEMGGSAQVAQNVSVLLSDAGGVYNAKGATFTLAEDAQICENTAPQSGGGVYNDGTFKMEGGVISGHTVTQFGGGVCNAKDAMFTLSGGTIQYNTAYDGTGSSNAINTNTGGGVYNAGTFVMEGGTISNNRAGKGGGILSGNPKTGAPATFTMTGGTIDNNIAEANGGGLFVFTNSTATISGGYITNNTSKAQNGGGFSGGGIYINQHLKDESQNGTLYLYNAAIYDNTSGQEDYPDGRKAEGSGIAACPYSNVHIYMTDGGAVFGNKSADGSPQPQIFVATPYDEYLDPERTHVVELSRYMLGGGAYHWTDASGAPLTDQQLHADNIAAYNTVTQDSDAAQAALQKAKVFIYGNTAADRGGGIGCNGNLYLGTGPENVLRVQKAVSGDATQTEFSFTLTLRDANGDAYTAPVWQSLDGGAATQVTPDAEGILTFTLQAGQQAEFLSLANGTQYTVAEAPAGACTTTVNGTPGSSASGVLTSGSYSAIEELMFLNQYPETETPEPPTSEPPAEEPPVSGPQEEAPTPQTPDVPAAATAASIPQTGDSLDLTLLYLALAGSLAGLCALAYRAKRRR